MATVAPYIALFQKLGTSAESVYNAIQSKQSAGNYSQDNLVVQEKQQQAVSRQMIKEAFAVMAEVMATTGSNENLTNIQYGNYKE